LLYHLVCPTKYGRAVISPEVDAALREVCLEISARYEVEFLEIGTDLDHVHFLIQSVPSYSPTRITRLVKSLTAREIFLRVPSVKTWLWGGAFWSSGFFINSVGRHGSEEVIRNYVKNQGRAGEYNRLYFSQLSLFDNTVSGDTSELAPG
jgi:REP element-mobilizing transposase RayT